MKHVVYDTHEKVALHWEFCDALRAHGISTNDQKVVNQIIAAFEGGEQLIEAFHCYDQRLTATLTVASQTEPVDAARRGFGLVPLPINGSLVKTREE